MAQSRNIKQKTGNKTQETVGIALRKGPIPDSEELAQYERILPGASERIFIMAEAEQKQRHALEAAQMHTQQEAVRLTARDSLIGMALGFTVAIVGISAAILSFLHGAAWPLSMAFLSLPIMIVAVELIRRKK